MFLDTRPAPLDADGALARWAEFRVEQPRERIVLLRQLRDLSVPVNLNAPDGALLASSLWTIDEARGRLALAADPGDPQLERVVECNEALAVAYLDSVKLQFELHGLVLVRGPRSCALQSELPHEIYRFQRRAAFRVRTPAQHVAVAHVRHPAIPDMTFALRVLDVSAGGCALQLPHDVPPLPPGIRIAGAAIELDADTRFVATLTLQHVTSIQAHENGVRLGCEWTLHGGADERALQRYIDQTQKRRRPLAPR